MLKESILEALESIKKNKLRSVLTGFGIAWGIFILTILLSISDSFNSGIKRTLGGLNSRDIFYEGGVLSDAVIGAVQGTQIIFDKNLLKKLANHLNREIEFISPIIDYIPEAPLKRKLLHTQAIVNGVTTDYFKLDKKKIIEGRLINNLDVSESRKVVLLGSKTKEKLFKEGEKVIGEYILIDSNWFRVIGIYKSATAFEYLNSSEVLIPFNTLTSFLNNVTHIQKFRVLPFGDTNPIKLEQKITSFLSKNLKFNTKDKNAIKVINSFNESEGFRKLISGLTAFLWFVGISLLTTGVIGVSNIMYMAVKERTKEIGIRKAIGASPRSITKMFLTESLLLTNFSGLIGFMTSYLILKLINIMFITEDSLLVEVEINFLNTIGIFLLLAFCGSLAGIFPAQKAAAIEPIEAIRYNE